MAERPADGGGVDNAAGELIFKKNKIILFWIFFLFFWIFIHWKSISNIKNCGKNKIFKFKIEFFEKKKIVLKARLEAEQREKVFLKTFWTIKFFLMYCIKIIFLKKERLASESIELAQEVKELERQV